MLRSQLRALGARLAAPLLERSQRAAASVEYAILVVLIAAVVAATVATLGGKTSALFHTLDGAF